MRYMRKKHNLLIGERTAEEIKINIGAAYRRPEVVTMEVSGRNLVTGLPKTIVVTSDETLEALKGAGDADRGRRTQRAWRGRLRSWPQIFLTGASYLREAEPCFPVWTP